MEFQTLDEFLKAPFGEPEIKSNDFENSYRRIKNKIDFVSYTTIDDNHLVHYTVGSETNKGEKYDVVLLFFTDDETLKKRDSLSGYYVKFFSNSPSFIYQYAALYKEKGFLIDMLYEKMDKDYMDVLPTKTNGAKKMSYDKSIYSTCRKIQDSALALSKMKLRWKFQNPDKFFRGIRDFQDVKVASEIKSLDKKINKELDKNKKENQENKKHRKPKKNNAVGTVKKVKTAGSSVKKVKRVKTTKSVVKTKGKLTTFRKK